MLKILFVCHGNICRSPMAEFILKDMAKKRGVEDKVEVSSCATSSEEIWHGVGNLVYPPARAELKKHGIDCGGKRAVKLIKSDYDKYDLIIGMDSANIRNMKLIFGSDPKNKIKKLLSYTGSERDVADPWYSDRFDIAYSDIYSGCAALLDAVLSSL